MELPSAKTIEKLGVANGFEHIRNRCKYNRTIKSEFLAILDRIWGNGSGGMEEWKYVR